MESFIVLAVVLSTNATLETTLIQVTRTMFSMGRDNTLPKVLGTVHDPPRRTKTSSQRLRSVAGYLALSLFIFSEYVGDPLAQF